MRQFLRREEKRREEKHSWHSALCILLSMLLLFISAPYSLIAQEVLPDEKFYSVSDSLSFSVDAEVTSFWDSHANIKLTITNCGEETIHNWFFIFDLPYDIENMWNESVV